MGERRFCKPEAVGSIPISSMLAHADARCRFDDGIGDPWCKGPLLGRLLFVGKAEVFDNLDG